MHVLILYSFTCASNFSHLYQNHLGLVFKVKLGILFSVFQRGIKMPTRKKKKPTRSNVLSRKYTLNMLCYRKVYFSLARNNCFLEFPGNE